MATQVRFVIKVLLIQAPREPTTTQASNQGLKALESGLTLFSMCHTCQELQTVLAILAAEVAVIQAYLVISFASAVTSKWKRDQSPVLVESRGYCRKFVCLAANMKTIECTSHRTNMLIYIHIHQRGNIIDAQMNKNVWIKPSISFFSVFSFLKSQYKYDL